jgi:general secretion pathway protein D
LNFRVLLWFLLASAVTLGGASVSRAATDPVAEHLARQAKKEQNAGHLVRAYMLYAEAAARDPQNTSYKVNRDALQPLAKLLSKVEVEKPDISADLAAAEKSAHGQGPPIERASRSDWERQEKLQPLPQVHADSSKHDFNLFTDTQNLLRLVAGAYGVQAIWEPGRENRPGIRFQITQADFRTALEAVTAATNTFVYPVSSKVIFFAQDTERDRAEYEPNVLLTFQLPNALDEKDLVEAANAVRSLLNLRTIGWDGVNRTVMIRDRISRARVARELFDALLLPKAQVSLEVQFLTFDTDRSYHYGVSMQTATELLDFGLAYVSKSFKTPMTTFSTFGTFGGGATLFGVAITGATLFASYSGSFSRTLYDATMVVDNGGTATLHVGEKFPIPQSLYTGFQQSSPSIYNPIGQFTEEDLGIVLKIAPRVNGDGEIWLDVEAEYKALGSQTFNTVPSILQREFKGNVSLHEGQWAVLAGMDQRTRSINRKGLIGLSQIPGLNQVFAENNRDAATSDTLVVIKPTITRLPMSVSISPQYLIGPPRGERVLL